MAVGFMNGVLCFCRTPGIMVGKSMKRWTSTGKNCCRKRLVVFSVLFLYLWYLLLTCMWHPVWCCLSFIEQLISEDNWVFLKESTSFISFFTPPFFLEGVTGGQAGDFSLLTSILVCLTKRLKWLITLHFTSLSFVQTVG